MKNGSRMRIKCYCRRVGSDRFRSFRDGLHYSLMTEMETVEHAERQDRRALNIRVLGAVKYLHKR